MEEFDAQKASGCSPNLRERVGEPLLKFLNFAKLNFGDIFQCCSEV